MASINVVDVRQRHVPNLGSKDMEMAQTKMHSRSVWCNYVIAVCWPMLWEVTEMSCSPLY